MLLLISSVVDLIVSFVGSSDFYNSLFIAPVVFFLFVNIVRILKLVVSSL